MRRHYSVLLLVVFGLVSCGSCEKPLVIEVMEPVEVELDPAYEWHNPATVEIPIWGSNALDAVIQKDEELIGVNVHKKGTLKARTRYREKDKRSSGRTFEFRGGGTNWIEISRGGWVS